MKTYKDIIEEKFPEWVGREYFGGVYGCPYNWFEGTDPPFDCANITCEECWGREYKNEKLKDT